MATPQPLYELLNLHGHARIPVTERGLLEATVASELIFELEGIFKKLHGHTSLNIIKPEEEKTMLDTQFFRIIIRDILTTGDYTLEGISRYTGLHEDLIHDVASGINSSPSVSLFHRLIDLHRTVHPALYCTIRENIINRLAGEKKQQFPRKIKHSPINSASK